MGRLEKIPRPDPDAVLVIRPRGLLSLPDLEPWGGWVPRWVRGAATAVGPTQTDGGIALKRCDLGDWPEGWPQGAHSLKAKGCFNLVGRRPAQPRGLVTGCSAKSPQSEIVAAVGRWLGLPVVISVSPGPESGHLEAARGLGAEILRAPVGWNSVVASAAAREARRRGWLEIPFGMVSPVAIATAALEAETIPLSVSRVVVVAGSGVAAAGLSIGLRRRGWRGDLVAVSVGKDPGPLLLAWGGGTIHLVRVRERYGDQVRTMVGDNLILHSLYEAKAWRFARSGDCFVVVGSSGSSGE